MRFVRTALSFRWRFARAICRWHGHQARLAAIRDITQRQRYEEEIEHQAWQLQKANEDLRTNNERLTELATTDGLTGLKNHRAFRGDARRRMDAFGPLFAAVLCLLMIDVDHFKSFNDSFGHPAGDEEFAAQRRFRIAERKRAQHRYTAARYGGEEFAVIQPNTDGPSGLILAERIRAAIEGEPWEMRAITVSIGAAWGLDYPSDTSDLVALADRALYQSKKGGRNRITLLSAADAPTPADIPAPAPVPAQAEIQARKPE